MNNCQVSKGGSITRELLSLLVQLILTQMSLWLIVVLKSLYDDGKLNFVANAGLLAKPVTTSDYSGETPVQLFAHNA